jgi:hypothetical protein
MAGDIHMWETAYGAGYGYGYTDAADLGSYGDDLGNSSHTHFIVWLVIFTLAATAILGGFRAQGFHFIVKV